MTTQPRQNAANGFWSRLVQTIEATEMSETELLGNELRLLRSEVASLCERMDTLEATAQDPFAAELPKLRQTSSQ